MVKPVGNSGGFTIQKGPDGFDVNNPKSGSRSESPTPPKPYRDPSEVVIDVYQEGSGRPPQQPTIEILDNRGSDGAGAPPQSASPNLQFKEFPEGSSDPETGLIKSDGKLYAQITGEEKAVLVGYNDKGELRAILEGVAEPSGPLVKRIDPEDEFFEIEGADSILDYQKQPENHPSADGEKRLGKSEITKYSEFLDVSEQKLKDLDRSLATMRDENRSTEIAKDAAAKFVKTAASNLSGMAAGATIGSMLAPGIGTALGIPAGLAAGAVTKKATQYAMKKMMETLNIGHPSYPKTQEARKDIEKSMESLIGQYVTPYLQTPEAFSKMVPEHAAKSLAGLFTEASIPVGDVVRDVESLTKGGKLSIGKSLKIIGVASQVIGTMRSLHSKVIDSLSHMNGGNEIQATGVTNVIFRKKISNESIDKQETEVNRRIDNILRQILDPGKYESPDDAEIVREYMLKLTGKSFQ
ncbi:hypothetical protein [Burkholderia ubonensis]|uniref:hypothetical protein n=1 Tax=Burkholderia ubonensis TaxID=101571 RepID=UPI000A5F276D|nr:hypothetical protein [Burkholderia ubonensis]